MEDRTGDPGKGLMRAKGKMRETMVDGAGGREGGRGKGEGTEETDASSGTLHAESPCPFLFPPPGISTFPCCGKDSVDIVERQ